MSHELYKPEKKKSIQIPKWEESAEENKAGMEDQIKELEYILFPEGTNVITLPKGFGEHDLKKIEEENYALIDKHKKLYGIL